MPSLFRHQALVVDRAENGAAIPWQTPQLHGWAWMITLCLLACLLWLGQMPLAEKISVDGVVQPHLAPVVVRSRVDGVVAQVLVREGQRVQAQQPLLTLSTRLPGAGGVSDAALQLAQLRDEHLHLRLQRLHTRSLAQHRQTLLRERQQSHIESLQLAQAEVRLARQQLTLAEQQHQRVQHLASKHWLSASELERSESVLMNARLMLLGQQSELQGIQARLRQVRAELDVQQATAAERTAALQTQLARVFHESERLKVSERFQLTAPITGVAVDHLIHIGKFVRSGEALLTVAPWEVDEQSVDVLLPSAAAPRVRQGLPVHLRFAGYPHQDHGAAKGEVGYVSSSPRADVGQPLFKARINITELPDSITEVPAGMVVSIDILLQTRPLWRWLWGPVQDALARL